MDIKAFKKYLASGEAPVPAQDDMLDLAEAAASGRLRFPMKAMPKPRLPPGSLARHDRIYHPNGYKEGDSCRFREEQVKRDYSDQIPDTQAGGGKIPPPTKVGLEAGFLHPDSEFRFGDVFSSARLDAAGDDWKDAWNEAFDKVVPFQLVENELYDTKRRGEDMDATTEAIGEYIHDNAFELFDDEDICTPRGMAKTVVKAFRSGYDPSDGEGDDEPEPWEKENPGVI